MSTDQSTGLITPTLTLPLSMNNSEGVHIGQVEVFKLFASIAANDDKGIVIDNVLPGDEIIIYDASGIASFRMTSMKAVKAAVGIANAVATKALLYATDGAALPFTKAWNSALDKIGDAVGDSKIKHSRRDPYGLDPGTDDYAKHEGGLIVCMPKARKAIYASDSYHLTGDTKNKGRKEKYYPKKAVENNVFYPCNVDGGRMSGVAQEAGAIHILAFDDKFSDNAGSYTVGMIVLRKDRPSGKSKDELIREIHSSPCSL